MNFIANRLPEANVGFDEAGVLKLFDFGLATQLAKDSDLDSTHDHLSGKVGTTRYVPKPRHDDLSHSAHND